MCRIICCCPRSNAHRPTRCRCHSKYLSVMPTNRYFGRWYPGKVPSHGTARYASTHLDRMVDCLGRPFLATSCSETHVFLVPGQAPCLTSDITDPGFALVATQPRLNQLTTTKYEAPGQDVKERETREEEGQKPEKE